MASHSVTVEQTLGKLLQEKRYSAIRDVLVTMNPADIAAIFNEVPREQLPLLFLQSSMKFQENSFRFCFAFCLRNRQLKRLWRWNRRHRSS